MQVDVSTSVGYALKRATTALHGAMAAELTPLGLSVSQYSCLELLGSYPGTTNASLARGAFVTRQAMHQLLGGLRAAGLVTCVRNSSCYQRGWFIVELWQNVVVPASR